MLKHQMLFLITLHNEWEGEDITNCKRCISQLLNLENAPFGRNSFSYFVATNIFQDFSFTKDIIWFPYASYYY